MLVQRSQPPPVLEPPSPLLLDKDVWLTQSAARRKVARPAHNQPPVQAHDIATPSIQSPARPSTPTPTPNTTFKVRPATISDAPLIVQLGASVFSATFGFSMPTSDLNAYLQESYNIEAIEDDIKSPTKHVFVACPPSNPSQILGFAQLTEGTTEPCLEEIEGLVELQRLYVNRDAQGTGVGKALVAKVDSLARERGYRNIWLGVWEGNFVAQKCYESLGWERVGDHEFRMGRCIQTDWIMCKRL